MLNSTIYARVRQNPKYEELVRRRRRLALTLSILVLGAYYTFMMVVAFVPGVLSRPMGDGMTLTIGVPVGTAIIVASWLLTGLYSHFANGTFEDLTNELIEDTRQ